MKEQCSFNLDGNDTAPQCLELADARAWLYPAFYPGNVADALLQRLICEIPWQQDNIQIAGRTISIPRLQAWFGDPGTDYSYTGLKLRPKPWVSPLPEIRRKLEAETGHRFNSVLLNYYRDGRDSVDWHADDEPELGPDPVIASLSFGTERLFQLRHQQDRKQPRRDCLLPHGSMLLMGAGMQAHWKHRVPKQPGLGGPRINLTFRQVSGL